jgi:hypothetical protein
VKKRPGKHKGGKDQLKQKIKDGFYCRKKNPGSQDGREKKLAYTVTCVTEFERTT